MKTAVIVSFALTGLCFIVTFVCKMFSTEVVFGWLLLNYGVAADIYFCTSCFHRDRFDENLI